MKRWLLPEKGTFYKANLHLHTTNSDGTKSPEVVKQLYKDRGYSILSFTDHDIFIPQNELNDENFLAINGHELEIDENPFVGGLNVKTYHLNFYAKDQNATLSPVFSERRVWAENAKKFVTDEMRKTDVFAYYSVDSINDLIRRANENGFFVTLNHPVWSLQRYPDYAGLKGLWGIEVYNHGCARDDLTDTTIPFDDLLWLGEDVFPICSDDSHADNDLFGGWSMIKAESLTYEKVIDALMRGDFYSSTGPEIRELTLEDGILNVRCAAPADLIVVSDWRANVPKRYHAERDGEDWSCSIPLSPFSKKYVDQSQHGWQDSYFRIEVVGADGKRAYTRAFRFRDFPELYE